MEGEIVTLQDIFVYKQTGIDENGKVKGHFTATGVIPSFKEELVAKGINVDMIFFNHRIK